MAFSYPPFNNQSAYYAGMPVGVELETLDKIILVGAKDLPIMRQIKRVPVGSLKSIWIIDQMRKPRSSTVSAKKYVEDIQPPTPDTKQEIENVVQLFLDEADCPDVLKNVNTIDSSGVLETQTAKRSLEHANDLEASFWSDSAPFLSTQDSEQNVVGGVWYYVPATHEFDYRDGLGNPTKDLSVDDIFDLQQAVYDRGGDPTQIFLTSKLKRKVNALIEAKKLYKVDGTDPKKIGLMVSEIETDFGTTSFNICRHMAELGMNDRMLCCDMEYIEAGMLQDTKVEPVTTSATKKINRITTHMTFHFRNQYALSSGYGFKY